MSRNAKAALCFWAAPACTVLFGGGYFAAELVAGQPAAAVVILAFMLVVGLALVFAARRSETIRGLMDRRDERITGIDVRATAAAGSLLIVAVLISGMVEMARGHSGAPYTWLAAVGGIGYVAVVALERVRR